MSKDRIRSIVPGRRESDRTNAEKAQKFDHWVKLIRVLTPIVLAVIGLATGILVVK